eukprot:SAG25_NODE_12278_length_283_cov_0.907609_1_plen_66_part_10
MVKPAPARVEAAPCTIEVPYLHRARNESDEDQMSAKAATAFHRQCRRKCRSLACWNLRLSPEIALP